MMRLFFPLTRSIVANIFIVLLWWPIGLALFLFTLFFLLIGLMLMPLVAIFWIAG